MARTLLFLSADSFQAYVWQRSSLAVVRSFSNDSDGREQFASFLERHKSPAYLLVDIIEEDFHLEIIPHLMGPSRKALLDRKFEQYYRSTPLRQATFLSRQEEGRRDDEFLLSALTNPQRISPWLEVLRSKHTPLAGIYSVPNISAPLLKTIESEHVLLLSWEKTAGMRQTYFQHKRLHFSRLIPILGSSFSEAVARETPRTQQYLKSLSLPPPGDILNVHIICHSSDKAELQAKLSSDNDLHYNFIDIQEFAALHKCKRQFTDSDSTPLFMNLLATKPPADHYANSDHTHFFTLWQMRRVLTGLAAVTALAGILWSGLTFMQGNDFASETQPILHQAEQVRQQTQQIQQSFSNLTVPAADMKTAVLLARNLNASMAEPQQVLDGLSVVLNDFPRINLGKLAWQTSAADAAPSPYPAQVITFDGELINFGNEHRKALDYLQRFEQAITQRGYTVTVVTMPWDVSSKGSLSGDIKTSEAKPAQFTLKIIWRHPQ